MVVELSSAALRLSRGNPIGIRGAAGSTVHAREGSVWITEENSLRDVVLAAGQSFRLHRSGLVVVEALGDASISFN